MRHVFIGEKPSRTAFERGWTWESGRLAASTLFDALRACGIKPESCEFKNLFGDAPEAAEGLTGYSDNRLRELRQAAHDPEVRVVAMGVKVARMLEDHLIPHVAIRHPAARGAGRGRDIYRAHVRERLAA